MTITEGKPPDITIPNLGGLIRKDDLYYKGKVPYCSWAKTAQRIRENAPNWFFNLEPDPNGQIVWMAPDNTGYLMGYYQNIETGIKLPFYPYAITNYSNKSIKYDQISSTDVLKAHRRCLCACACFSFGDAFELWAGLEIEESEKEEKQAPPPEKEGVGATRTKPNEKLESNDVLKKLPKPISKEARKAVLDHLATFHEHHPETMKKIVASFRDKFGIKDTKITKHITTAEHGEFLTYEINKILENL